MQTLTVRITHANAIKALQDLEEKRFIKIIDELVLDSPALPGKELNLQEFKNWIAGAEASDTISLLTAKSLWLSKRKQLKQLVK